MAPVSHDEDVTPDYVARRNGVTQMELRGQRAIVLGLGRHGGGVAAARWLAGEGAIVTVLDRAEAAELADSIAALADVDIADWRLGRDAERDSDLTTIDHADLVVVNPAVRPGHPLVSRAVARGVRITSELELFLERCPGHVIGVTGSNGKSTTAAMIAAMLRADSRSTFVGGNIGHSLLGDLDTMTSDSWVVLEISSFQLAWLSRECRLPGIAVLTNFTANHLDWHGTVAHYAAAKQRLFAELGTNGVAVADLNTLGPEWNSILPEKVVAPVADGQLPALRVPGVHNRSNAALAAATALAAGCSPAGVEAALREYEGLPHRLELVAMVAGREFYNDSMATTPESTIAAMRTFSGRCWLLIGGYDKGIDMSELLSAIPRHARGVAFYGASSSRLHEQWIAMSRSDCPSTRCETLDAGFDWCWRQSQSGEAILLSPACASYDQFVDYRARGERFRELVRTLDSCAASRSTVQQHTHGR
jgi:UDP-N-acetylmuramoylalanine--D-glutamate ligase